MIEENRKKAPEMEVMVVDADSESKGIAKNIFERLGYKVIEANNGTQVFKIIDDRPWSWLPKVIFVDLLIPGLSGYEVIRRLSEKYEGKKMLIAVTSSLCTAEDVTEAQLAGARVFIKKPFTAEKLEDAIKAGFETLQNDATIKKSIISILD